jgi:hypothetical protein
MRQPKEMHAIVGVACCHSARLMSPIMPECGTIEPSAKSDHAALHKNVPKVPLIGALC